MSAIQTVRLILHLRSRSLRSFDHMIISGGRAHFLLYALSGKLTGYQRYNPWGKKLPHSNTLGDDAKYYTWVSSGEVGFWGAQFYDPYCPLLFITEGIFNAVKVVNEGWPCFAMLTATPSKSAASFLNMLPNQLVIIKDNDGHAVKPFEYVDGYSINQPRIYGDVGNMPQPKVGVMINQVLEKFNVNEERVGYPNHRRKSIIRFSR